MNYIIVDDEPIAHTIIEDYAASLQDLTLVANCYSAFEALDILKSKSIDLMFLDIEMPKLKGMDFIKVLDKKPAIIITSAYSEFAIEGYELDVIDYLLKPFSFERFFKAYTKVLSQQQQNTSKSSTVKTSVPDKLFLKGDKEIHQINLNDLIYIESYGNYVKINLLEKVLLIHESISNLENLLKEQHFIRIHRSFLTNIAHIQSIIGNRIKLSNGDTIPIGQSYKLAVKEKLLN
ncbi:LytR/AlgR family response regulator transcription factor [Aquimarina brevivitae]|uniref:LytTR family two component transcriptional regulator n=1 Tax=Aquimarina brevivitae TaxID=323412 RepID=A0A4Q7PHU4_9FLAO|nr:LytTR family DNA-binding domain-containing protein [Aquimarina brevivitae]RZS99370.1 LytTR family two component transcriptional regulator [Aquimarina brevivitae]